MEEQVSIVTIISVQSHLLYHIFMVKQNFIIDRIKYIGKSSWVNVNAMQYKCPVMQKRLNPTKKNTRLLVLCRLRDSHYSKQPSQSAKFQRKTLFFVLKEDTLLLFKQQNTGAKQVIHTLEQLQEMLGQMHAFSYSKTRLTASNYILLLLFVSSQFLTHGSFPVCSCHK